MLAFISIVAGALVARAASVETSDRPCGRGLLRVLPLLLLPALPCLGSSYAIVALAIAPWCVGGLVPRRQRILRLPLAIVRGSVRERWLRWRGRLLEDLAHAAITCGPRGFPPIWLVPAARSDGMRHARPSTHGTEIAARPGSLEGHPHQAEHERCDDAGAHRAGQRRHDHSDRAFDVAHCDSPTLADHAQPRQ
jgi:hypothetical protein